MSVPLGGMIRGEFLPEAWQAPLAIGLGVVITGFMGDTIAGFISQFVPAEWLNPATELVAGIILFVLGGFIGGDWKTWMRLFSIGAFAVGIADAITVLLGLTAAPAPAAVRVVTAKPMSVKTVNTTLAQKYRVG